MMIPSKKTFLTQKIIGTFEPVSFPGFGGITTTAKIDTGAYTGALHCSRIEEKTEDGEAVLYYWPLTSHKPVRETNFVVKHVKSSNGGAQQRHFVTAHIQLHGIMYPILLSLSARHDMRSPVLIGRRFLRKHRFLVDPSIINKHKPQVKVQ